MWVLHPRIVNGDGYEDGKEMSKVGESSFIGLDEKMVGIGKSWNFGSWASYKIKSFRFQVGKSLNL